MPSKGPNSPYSPGFRTLLARTCASCGELADGDSYPMINKGEAGRRRNCHKCHNAKKKRDREERGIGVPPPRPPEALQTSRWAKWSAADDKFLRENIEILGYEAVAVALGRSMKAVYRRREILGMAPVRMRHRVAKPWQIRSSA